jgi:hypothetical protein
MLKRFLLVLFIGSMLIACAPAATPTPAPTAQPSATPVTAWVPEGNEIVAFKNPVPLTPGNDYLTSGVSRQANFQEFSYVDGAAVVLEDGCSYPVILKANDNNYVDLDLGVCPNDVKNGGFWIGEVVDDPLVASWIEDLIRATPRNVFGIMVRDGSDAEANYKHVQDEAKVLGWDENTHAVGILLYIGENGEITKLCYYTMNESWLSTTQLSGLFDKAFPNYSTDGGKKSVRETLVFLQLIGDWKP